MFIRPRRAAAALACSLALLAVAATSPAAAAVTTAQWNAKIGPAGVNGTATIKVFSTKTGSIAVALKGLAHSTIYTETVYAGTCAKQSKKLLVLPTLKTTSAGKAARTNTLTAAQATLVNKSGEVIRLVAGTHVFCGVFTAVKLPPPPPAVSATIGVGVDPTGVTLTPTGVLVANWYDSILSRIDPATNSLLASIPLQSTGNEGPQALTYGEGAIWVAMLAYDDAAENAIAGSVERVDATSGLVVANIPVGKGSFDITTSPGAVWVTNFNDDTVNRIDPATNQVAATIPVAGGPTGIAFGFGAIWVTSEKTGGVSRIDPATNQIVTTIPTVGTPEGVTTGAGSVWVANWGHGGQPDGVLSRIDPATNQVVRTIPVGTNPLFVAFGGGYVWIALNGVPSPPTAPIVNLVQVNPTTNAVQTSLQTGPLVVDHSGATTGLWGIAASDHDVWVVQPIPAPDENSSQPPGKLIRVSY